MPAGLVRCRTCSGSRATAPANPHPAGASWRSDAALAHLALGARAEAKALAAEEVALAQAFNGQRTRQVAAHENKLSAHPAAAGPLTTRKDTSHDHS